MLRCRSFTTQALHLPRCQELTAPVNRSRLLCKPEPVRKSTPANVRLCASAAGVLTAPPHQTLAHPRSVRALRRIAWSLVLAGAVAAFCVLASSVSGAGLFASTTTAGGAQAGLHSHIAITSAASGMAAGFLHTLCGPDHLAALTPLTIGRNRFAASFLGSLWGLGHSTGQLLLGLAFAFLKEQFTAFLPFLERWAGTIVGLTLIAIGALGIYETQFEADDSGDHDDEEKLRQITDKSNSKGEARIAMATYGTGILYGLQPDALFVVIPALALPSYAAAFAYCVMFVIGTVLAMGGYTLFIGTASEELCRDRPWLRQNLSVVASCIAIGVGILVLLAGMGVDVPFWS